MHCCPWCSTPPPRWRTRCTSPAASREPAALATALLAAGVLAHTFLIGMQTMEVGHAPLVGTTAAISAFVWLLGCRTSTSS